MSVLQAEDDKKCIHCRVSLPVSHPTPPECEKCSPSLGFRRLRSTLKFLASDSGSFLQSALVLVSAVRRPPRGTGISEEQHRGVAAQ